MAVHQKGRPIIVNTVSCTGCLICALRCSFRFEKEFNPSWSAIKVLRVNSDNSEFNIIFTDRCDNCGICARFCPYGALIHEGRT